MKNYINSTPVAKQVPFDNSTNGFVSSEAQSAIEEAKQNAQGFPRAAVRGTYNGTVSNNQWLGPQELLPNTPLCVFPVNTQLNEITWSNATANVAFSIQFRRGSKTGAIFYTLVVTSPNIGRGFINGLTFTFTAGEAIFCQYIDQGTNASDMNLDLWISRIP